MLRYSKFAGRFPYKFVPVGIPKVSRDQRVRDALSVGRWRGLVCFPRLYMFGLDGNLVLTRRYYKDERVTCCHEHLVG